MSATSSSTLSDVELAAELQKAAHDDPPWYLREILGISTWAKQDEIVRSIDAHEKTLVYSCVSSGKSFIGGAIIPWWLNSRHPARVFVIAPTERQIKINIWSELARVYGGAQIPLGGKLLTLDWQLGDGWLAKGFSPKDAFAVFGIHGPHDLFIFDDAQGIAPQIFDGFENAAAGGTAHFLYFCNPAVVSGQIYDWITGRRTDCHSIQIDADSTPNVRAGRVVVPGLIVKEKRDEWVKKYGWDSDFVRVKVRALPPKQEPDTLIPIDWLEIARHREVPQGQRPVVIGQDVARFGDDLSVQCVRSGRQILAFRPEWILSGNKTTEVTGRLIMTAKELKADEINVDDIGIGGGVTDQAQEKVEEQDIRRGGDLNKRVNVRGINVSEKARDEVRFINRRSELWWAARESLDPENATAMALPIDCDDLIADLSAMKYSVNSRGQIVVEPKKDTKARLGRSPDHGDAYVLAVGEAYEDLVKPANNVAFSGKLGLPRLPSWL